MVLARVSDITGPVHARTCDLVGGAESQLGGFTAEVCSAPPLTCALTCAEQDVGVNITPTPFHLDSSAQVGGLSGGCKHPHRQLALGASPLAAGSLLFLQPPPGPPWPLLALPFSCLALSVDSVVQSSVVSDSATPWTATHQASLSFTISRSLFKLMPTESMMPSNHLI